MRSMTSIMFSSFKNMLLQKDSKMFARKFAIIIGPVLLLVSNQIAPTSAIFNCFTPNMFKMGKGGQPQPFGGYGGADRASWYPQQQMQPMPYGVGGYPMTMGYGQNPMKWRGSLFGPKKWMGNANFYRPGFGYGSMMAPSASLPAPPPGSYQFNEQLNVAPFQTHSLPTSSYANDGWSAPIGQNQAIPIQQSQLHHYDGYAAQPYNSQPAKQQQPTSTSTIDPYGGTKGGSGKQYSTTKKNVLLANGGYNSYDAHLLNYLRNQTMANSGGYAYPDWYSGSTDSPAKIAQQLYRLQERRRQQLAGLL